MRKILILSLATLAGCHLSENKNIVPPETSKTHVVNLKGGLGTISLALPARYDTTFTWIHYSDCGAPCEVRKYRFQPKTLPVNMENGYFYKTLQDSVEQFTIVHNPYIPAGDSDKTDNRDFIISFHDHKKFDIIHDPRLRTDKI